MLDVESEVRLVGELWDEGIAESVVAMTTSHGYVRFQRSFLDALFI